MGKETIGKRAIRYVADEHLAPWLKSLGYKKSKSTFFKLGDVCSRQICLQGSWTDSADRGTLRIFMGLVWHAGDQFASGKKALPRPYYRCTAKSAMHGRLWWKIDQTSDLDQIADEVKATCESEVLPWFEAYEAFVEIIASEKNVAPDHKQIFFNRLSCRACGISYFLEHGCSREAVGRILLVARKYNLPLPELKTIDGRELMRQATSKNHRA